MTSALNAPRVPFLLFLSLTTIAVVRLGSTGISFDHEHAFLCPGGRGKCIFMRILHLGTVCKSLEALKCLIIVWWVLPFPLMMAPQYMSHLRQQFSTHNVQSINLLLLFIFVALIQFLPADSILRNYRAQMCVSFEGFQEGKCYQVP